MDLRRADLGLLVSLDALLETESVTLAAKKLGISQPALSAQLARLRDIFHDPLLVGNAQGMVPTTRAAEIRAPLRAVLADLSALVHSGVRFDPAESGRIFKIAATDLAHAILLPALLRHLREVAPGLRIEARSQDRPNAVSMLERGALDMLIARSENLPPGLPSLRLVEEDFRVIWRDGHPLVGDAMSFETFCSLGHVVTAPEGGGFEGQVDESLRRRGRHRRIAASLPGFLLAAAAVRATDLVAVLPSAIALLDDTGLRMAPVPFELPGFVLHLCWHSRADLDPGHRWMRETLQSVAAGTVIPT